MCASFLPFKAKQMIIVTVLHSVELIEVKIKEVGEFPMEMVPN